MAKSDAAPGVKGDLSGISFHVDVDGLYSEEAFQNDVDGIFRKSWLPLCHDYDIPNPGDFRLRKIPTLNYNLLIVRGKDHVVRVFHNICRHRGNQLVCKDAGSSRQGFSCGYHGWTYNIDGSLRAMTDRSQFPPYGDAALGLREVRSEIRHSFVFVTFDDATLSLDDWLEDLAPSALYEGYFENFKTTELITTTINANWNIVMDAFCESYHTLFVHKNTGTDYLGDEDNPMRHNPVVEVMQRHARLSPPVNPNHRWAPSETLAYTYTNRAFPAFDTDSTGSPPGINFGGSDGWAFDVVKLFPNVIILFGKDWFIETWTWPTAKDETVYEWSLVLRTPKTYGERVAQEFSYVINREIACEDLFLLERQQKVMESGAVKDYFLSFQELVVAHHYRSRKLMLEGADA